VLPADDTDLETAYTPQDVQDVSSLNGVFVSQGATGLYTLHQFKDYLGSSTTALISCYAQSNRAPSLVEVYLQVYNHNSATWETIASNNTSAANTTFLLQANIADTTDYLAGGIISCRVYQLAP
jgi:hypothetical protein